MAYRLPSAAFIAASALLLVLAACGRGKVSRDECTRMLDHYLDMTIAADPSLAQLTPSQAEAVREIKKAIKKADKSYAQVHNQCEAEVTRGEYRCAIAAKTPNDWEACIE